jgi:hypothetical protein
MTRLAILLVLAGCGANVECDVTAEVAYDAEAWPYLCIDGQLEFVGVRA